LVTLDLDDGLAGVGGDPLLARPWRRQTRAGVYDSHFVQGDPRNVDRARF
jgi:hypothetical protein